MKKISLFILIVLMLFAFVACNPNSSSSNSADAETLPGEVTPPAESERKSMSDADIVKVAGLFDILWSENTEYVEVVREETIEVDFGDSGSLSIKENRTEKDDVYDTTYTVNGKITVDGNSYDVDNLVLVHKAEYTSGHNTSFDCTIEKGSITKNGTALSAEDAYHFLCTNFYGNDQCKAYTEEGTDKKTEKVLDDKNKIIGTGTEITKRTRTKDEDQMVMVCDFTIEGSRVQAKLRQSGDEPSIDYVALDGVFFDKASCDKLLPLIY